MFLNAHYELVIKAKVGQFCFEILVFYTDHTQLSNFFLLSSSGFKSRIFISNWVKWIQLTFWPPLVLGKDILLPRGRQGKMLAECQRNCFLCVLQLRGLLSKSSWKKSNFSS